MKKAALILITLIVSGCFFNKDVYDAVRKTPKFKFVPPGTVWLRDNLFMDKTEITNVDWLEFLFWASRNKPKAYYDSVLPDTLVWEYMRALAIDSQPISFNIHGQTKVIKYSEGDCYAIWYLRNPVFQDDPVVGINYWQAQEFCKWRTDRVNEYIYVRRNKIKWTPSMDSLNSWPKVVNYRLPTEEEWDYAAAAGLDFDSYPMGYESLTDKNNKPVSVTQENGNLYGKWSFKYGKDSLPYWKEQHFPQSVFYGKPNKYGLYNMLGNVSEIIANSTVKGLNYLTSIVGVTGDSNYSYYSTDLIYDYKKSMDYEKPEAWLGFRCICEVLEKK